MSNDSEEIAHAVVEKMRKQERELKQQLGLLRKFHLIHWIVATLGLIIFSQSLSFARWNQYSSLESNFNDHATLLAGCGMGFILIAAGVLVLHRRITKLEKLLEDKLRNE